MKQHDEQKSRRHRHRARHAARDRHRRDLAGARWPGKSGIGPITHFDHTAVRDPLRRRGEGLRSDALDDVARGEDHRPVHPVRASRRASLAMRRRGPRDRGRVRRARRLLRRRRPGRRDDASRTTCTHAGREGAAPRHLAVLRADDHRQHGARARSRSASAPRGRTSAHVSACSTGAHAIGEALRVHPARRRRRHDLRRHRGDGHAARRGRLQQHARAVDAQRRAPAGVAAVRQRIATASSSPRAPASWSSRSWSTPRRAARKIYAEIDGLRRQRRRAPHHGARAGRRGRAALHEAGAQGRAARRRRRSATSTRTARRRR